MSSLRQQFRDDFSRTAFQLVDGEERIVGKYGQIVQMDDGSFDCWFVGQNLRPLTGRRIASIRQNLPAGVHLTELTGEAYAQGRGRGFVKEMAVLAGIRRKRRVSQATREHLARIRSQPSARNNG